MTTLDRKSQEPFDVRKAYAMRDAFCVQRMLAAKAGASVYENTMRKLMNVSEARKQDGRFSIQAIFREFWPDFERRYASRLRSAIVTNIHRMIGCRDWKNGYLFFACPQCENYQIQGLSCHSRICATCGKKYREQRTQSIAARCLNVPHRQFVFSIAKELRPYFREYRGLFDVLFHSVYEALVYLIWGKSKKARREGRSLGFIQFLHTFGRDLKFNPHIHVLIAERTIDASGSLVKYDHFHYESLRKSFMNQLLKNIYAFLKVHADKSVCKQFYQLKTKLFQTYKDGFYAHGPKLANASRVAIRNVTEYIARYAAHPAIAEERIVDVDSLKRTVTFYYDPHEDDHVEDPDQKRGRQYVTLPVDDFLADLIVHVPDKGFHTIRAYGFYANRSRLPRRHLSKLYSVKELAARKTQLRWRNLLKMTFRFDPLLCDCGHVMVFDPSLSYYPSGGG
jgi:hypothetical protein